MKGENIKRNQIAVDRQCKYWMSGQLLCRRRGPLVCICLDLARLKILDEMYPSSEIAAKERVLRRIVNAIDVAT